MRSQYPSAEFPHVLTAAPSLGTTLTDHARLCVFHLPRTALLLDLVSHACLALQSVQRLLSLAGGRIRRPDGRLSDILEPAAAICLLKCCRSAIWHMRTPNRLPRHAGCTAAAAARKLCVISLPYADSAARMSKSCSASSARSASHGSPED